MDTEPGRIGEGSGRARAAAVRAVALGACLFALPGCSVLRALDFGGDDKKAFEFAWGWEHGVAEARPGTKPGGVDDQGVYKPETPEAEAVLGFPNVHAGVAGEIRPKGRMTPTVAVEAFRVKFPYVRWWELQVGAGAQIAEVSFTKRLVSVFEITAGPWAGWDFEESHKRGPNFLDKMAWGVTGTLIKF